MYSIINTMLDWFRRCRCPKDQNNYGKWHAALAIGQGTCSIQASFLSLKITQLFLQQEVIENKEQHELVQELTQQLNQTQEKLQLVKQSIQETTRTQSNNNVATNCGTDNKKREELTPEEKSVLAKLNREKEQLEDLVMTLKKQLKTFSTDDEIHRRGYHLIKGDLRDIAILEKKLKFCNIDWKKPTLIFAECVLTYIHPEDSDKIIQWISGAFDNVLLMAYEQIVPKVSRSGHANLAHDEYLNLRNFSY